MTVLTFLVANNAIGQIEIYDRFGNGHHESNINIFVEKGISKKVTLTGFALVEKTWSEALVGFTYAPKDWVSFGASVGIEQNSALYRTAYSVWLGKNKNSLLALFEKGDGADNYWYKVTLSHDFSNKFSIAARAWRYHGVGPVFTYTLPKPGVSWFIMPAYDLDSKEKKVIAGIAIALKKQ